MQHPFTLEHSLKTLGISALAAGLLVLSGCSDKQQDAVEEVEESAAEVVETTGTTETGAEDTTAGSDEPVAEGSEEGESAWDKTKDFSKETWDKAKKEAAQPPAEADAQTKQIEDR